MLMLVVLISLLGLVAEGPGVAHASPATVTNCGDAVPTPPAGSLRAAINAASTGDTITFSVSCNGINSIKLVAPLTISTNNLTVDGSGQNVTLDGSGAGESALQVSSGITFNLNALTIANGKAFNGGGLVSAANSTVNITNSTFANNSAIAEGGGIVSAVTATVNITNSTFANNSAGTGGGIENGGTVNITNSTFASNSAGTGGGLDNANTMNITNSTFASNSASIQGGGLVNAASATMNITNSTFANNSTSTNGGGLDNFGIVTITNSTFANNSATVEGGGTFNNPASVVNLAQSIVANNTASTGANCFGSSLTTQSYNLSNDTSCFMDGVNNSIVTSNPGLDPLGLRDNGGPTQTIALLSWQPGYRLHSRFAASFDASRPGPARLPSTRRW